MTRHVTCGECRARLDRAESVECEGCGQRFHADCLPYHTEYECRDSPDLAVGAVEF